MAVIVVHLQLIANSLLLVGFEVSLNENCLNIINGKKIVAKREKISSNLKRVGEPKRRARGNH